MKDPLGIGYMKANNQDMADYSKDDTKKLFESFNGLSNGIVGDVKDAINNNSVLIDQDKDKCVALKKRMGLMSGVALIVGTMIGSGIFISPKGVLMSTGSVGLSFVVWLGCGVLALMGALSYAELGTMITKSGAEYAYLKDAFGPLHKNLGPVPAFLFAWTSVLILKPALFGVVAMSFGLYAVEPFFPCGPSDIAVKLVAIVCLSGGAVMIARGETEYLESGFEGSQTSPSIIALAFYDGLWAYDGWNNLNYVTEELKDPYKNLPRAIMIGIPLVTVCYILTNVSYLTVLSPAELLSASAVATTWGQRVLGVMAFIIPLSVVFSTFGAANGSCFTGGRVMFVAAREGHLPEVLSFVHTRQFTPLPSLVVSTILACVLVLMGDIFALIDFFSFAAWMFYGLTMAALIVMRYTQKDAYRPYKVPIIIPIIVLLCSFYLVIAPILQNPRIEFLYASIFMFSGLIFYVPFVVYKKELSFMRHVTYLVQMVFCVAPSRYDKDIVE
ncbi:solute carrier family 7 (L-type amino acid transporter), member 9 [Mytilus galloprovincialis]|uniref:Solute carrier family 7 (L-type amino acid transporter), member 9 n=1 Tax=Mytilus galloprovincialis TaxID=29158 RepID=A0A8B6DH07_MYTGA|nr:solute carrier family 7 (L-type amino acid transporter), member 9 [Mytilus galloprovincialis]